MSTNTTLKKLLCEQWCADALVSEDEAGIRLSLPLYEADGDSLVVWLKPELGGWRIEDNGTTLMRLSYDMDIDLLETGQRAKVFEAILRETSVSSDNGNLYMVVQEGDLGLSLLNFGQAMSRIGDMKLWNKSRVANTFYDDLADEILRIAGPEVVVKNYFVPGLDQSEDYPIDFYLQGASKPLYIFGVPSGDKAKLATIVLQRLTAAGLSFESLIVPSDIEAIPPKDFRRLMNEATDMIDSIKAKDALERKIKHRLV